MDMYGYIHMKEKISITIDTEVLKDTDEFLEIVYDNIINRSRWIEHLLKQANEKGKTLHNQKR